MTSHGTARNLVELVLILVVAIAGKTVGTYAAARACAVPRLQSTVLAALMNTRGLTEIVILTTGLQLNLIGPGLYTLMVVMALATTAMTGPLLRLLGRRAGHDIHALGDIPTGTHRAQTDTSGAATG